mmetsp:Transcript_73996/g.154272  ORF Transcript_73996/g.154272 Transcript_73996/m.154272 type:complete len:734 (+) Transcript_73996:87-2288(+)|eukprot:CAMPEP_0206499988 /NCGR_PEP_ID=MMETSP0324_2-20121206/52104_1 /ASSEMBLY_ACC=CAM_ASM_000836 /TAXON_ID=2866 /ORGANISM="Crypthecodinium cohnii, Strain Seligo" /LENGTH=733 /DNA_ID=CAMNT_0053986845 /DNA_START=209 /DNA_END=2410 /DNA_ORIENTATION=+
MPPMDQRCRVEVECQETRFGDQLCCVGEATLLGHWDPSRSAVLTTDMHSFPKWYTDNFPLLREGSECKFIIRSASGDVHWEEFSANRTWPKGVGQQGIVRAKFGTPGMEIIEVGTIEEESPRECAAPDCSPHYRRLSCGKIVDAMQPTTTRSDASTESGASGGGSSHSESLSPTVTQEALTPCRKNSFERHCENPSHVQFIWDNRGQVQDFYDLDGDALGSGNSGCVTVAKNLRTGMLRAVKTIHRLRIDDLAKFKQEIEIMKMMDHPNVIKLYEHFEDAKNFHLVMELCAGGDLFDHIIQARDFSEKHAAHVMDQILKGINYIHLRQVAHRDIKPENFLLCNKEPIEHNTIKIIDFGLSHICAPGQVLTTRLGTPTYVAPEVLRGAYGQPADIWSCGVVLYVLLSGKPPFDGPTDQHTFRAIRAGEYSFSGVCWERVSAEAKELIRGMICLSPMLRLTAGEALSNDWMRSTMGAEPSKAHTKALGAELVENLRRYKNANLLKKVTLQIIAWRFLDQEKMQSMEEKFRELDVDGDGVLSLQEIRTGLKSSGVEELPAELDQIADSAQVLPRRLSRCSSNNSVSMIPSDVPGVVDMSSTELDQIIDDVDTEGNGTINYTAFMAATMARRASLLGDVLQAAFNVFDKDGDGKISEQELREVLDPHEEGRPGSEYDHASKIAEILRQADADGDGEIDFQEFRNMMGRTGSMTNIASLNVENKSRRDHLLECLQASS